MKNTIIFAIASFVIGVILTYWAIIGSVYGGGNDCNDAGMKHMRHEDCYENNNMSGMMHDMASNLDGKSGDDFDRAFIEEMVIHHEGAVDMAKMAESSSNRAEIKNLSQAIIESQSKEIDSMKSWYKKWFGEDLK